MSHLSPTPGVPQTAAKAGVSAVLAAVATALTAYFTGTDAITWRGVLAAVVAGAVAGGGTYLAPNKAKASEAGQGNLATVVYVLAAVLIVVLLFLLTPLNLGHG